MTPSVATLTSQIVHRRPMESDGNSGNPIEAVVLRDGRQLVLKRVSPEWDWMARETRDDGRVVRLWETGMLARVPPVIDHAIVGVEREETGWNIFMRDISETLIPRDARLGRADVRRLLEALRRLHDAFRGEALPGMCSLEDRYSLFSPATAARQLEGGNRHGVVFTVGWDTFFDRVPGDVADAVSAILDRPQLLAQQLDRCDKTLIHGNVRLGNLGFSDGRVVLIDWGERVGAAPAAVEVGWFLAFDGLRLDASNDDALDDFRRVYGDRSDERALQLALIGSLVQIGGLLGFRIRRARSEGHRAALAGQLSWWVTTVEGALAVWSPT